MQRYVKFYHSKFLEGFIYFSVITVVTKPVTQTLLMNVCLTGSVSTTIIICRKWNRYLNVNSIQ